MSKLTSTIFVAMAATLIGVGSLLPAAALAAPRRLGRSGRRVDVRDAAVEPVGGPVTARSSNGSTPSATPARRPASERIPATSSPPSTWPPRCPTPTTTYESFRSRVRRWVARPGAPGVIVGGLQTDAIGAGSTTFTGPDTGRRHRRMGHRRATVRVVSDARGVLHLGIRDRHLSVRTPAHAVEQAIFESHRPRVR